MADRVDQVFELIESVSKKAKEKAQKDLKEVKDYFLTLHDDSMLISNKTGEMIREVLENYSFGGYLDTRQIKGYNNVLLDGIPISSLRIGTWFLFGDKKTFLQNKYTTGLYKTLNQNELDKYFSNSKRIKFINEPNAWLNGGFNLNIQARIDNNLMLIIDKFPEKYAEHITKVTGFFAPRDMLDYADTKKEIKMWESRIKNLKKATLPKGTMYKDPEFDISFLEKLTKWLESEEIYDQLLNKKTIEKLKNLL